MTVIEQEREGHWPRRRFEGRVAIVAGAGQGIGRATAHRLASEGAEVMVADMVPSLAQKVCTELADLGARASAFVGDLSVLADVKNLMAATAREFGRIDVLVNVAGGGIWVQPFDQYSPEQVEAEIRRALWPSVWLCFAVLPYMIAQKRGAIVNLATHAFSYPGRVPYATAKGGVIGLTISLAREVAQHNIRVNCVAPHVTLSADKVVGRDYGVGIPGPIESELEQQERIRNRLRDIPMGRAAKPEEQAAAIAFLASDDASFITGQVIPVGGGATFPF